MVSKGKKVDLNNTTNAKPELVNVITQFSNLIDQNFPLDDDDQNLTLQERYESKKKYFASLCEINTLIRDIRNRCIEDMKKLYRLSVNTDEAEVENLDNDNDNDMEADVDGDIEEAPLEKPVKVNKPSKSKSVKIATEDLNEDNHNYPEETEKPTPISKKSKKTTEKVKTSVKASSSLEATDGTKIVKAVKTKTTKVKATNDDDEVQSSKSTKTEKVVKPKEPVNETTEKKTVKKQVVKKKV